METTENKLDDTDSTSMREPDRASGTRASKDIVDIKDAATEVASSVNKLYQASHDFLHRQAKERPYVMLGAIAGMGFVLGGGLTSRLTGVLLTVGGRMLSAELTETLLRAREQGDSNSEIGV